MRIDDLANDRAITGELGRRIAAARLARDIPQRDLARRAGISTRALSSLEGGAPSSLRTLIHVLRALGMAGNLDLLVPEQPFSPLAVRPDRPTVRRRASTRRDPA